MSLLCLNHDDVGKLLTPEAALEAVEAAHRDLAAGAAFQPLRRAEFPPGSPGFLGLMPGALGGSHPALGVKALAIFPRNRDRGLASHQGALLLFSPETGEPEALIDADAVTAIRTAAASALATRLLARPDAGDLAILGAGVQARTHLAALSRVRPLRRVRAWSPHPERVRAFAESAAEDAPVPVEPASSPEAAARGADLLVTVTASREPVLLGGWVAPGAHVNAVGACIPSMREIDSDLAARASIFTDVRESALAEAGDLLIPIREGRLPADPIRAELGALLTGAHPGRTSPDETTLYESLGVAIQDLAVGRFLVGAATAAGVGTRVAF